jgi:MGT family glycosyltransferase
MRALFTVQPAIGHLHPLVPVARALGQAGHDVAFCSSASFRSEIEAFGFKHFGAGLDWLASDRATWTPFPPMPAPSDASFPEFVVTVFADVTTRAMAPDVLEIAKDWKPDLVVREVMEWSGCLVAEQLQIPHVSIGGNAYSGVDSPAVAYFPGNRQFAAEPYARHRAELGLPADPDLEMPFRYLHLCFMPRRWDRPGLPAPANTEYVRHVNVERPGGASPAWLDELPDRPTVYAALGTIAHAMPGIFELILDALDEADVNLILAVGGDTGAFGTQPRNVHIESFVPQTRVLPRCDAFITHGGFNSVKESLSVGVPMVVVPITADQPYSAGRCAALGVARVVGPEERTADVVRSAVDAVLSDASFRSNAQDFRAEMDALPGPEHVVELLESLQREPANAG